MYAWDNGIVFSGKVRREMISWGVVVILRTGGKRGFERTVKNECGSFPLEEGLRMAEQLGSVGTSCGVTVNLGNFQSARVDVWMTVPCAENEAEAAYQRCHDFVSKRVQDEAEKITKENEESKKQANV